MWLLVCRQNSGARHAAFTGTHQPGHPLRGSSAGVHCPGCMQQDASASALSDVCCVGRVVNREMARQSRRHRAKFSRQAQHTTSVQLLSPPPRRLRTPKSLRLGRANQAAALLHHMAPPQQLPRPPQLSTPAAAASASMRRLLAAAARHSSSSGQHARRRHAAAASAAAAAAGSTSRDSSSTAAQPACLEGRPLDACIGPPGCALQLMAQEYSVAGKLMRLVMPLDVDAVLDMYIQQGTDGDPYW